MQSHPRITRIISASLLFLFIAGSLPLLSGCQMIQNQPVAPTTNPTLLSIMVMLTQTAAAPTATSTPTPGPEPTQTITVFVPSVGSIQKPIRIGEQINQNGLVLTVLSKNSLNEVGTTKASEGQVYLDIAIILDNTTGQVITYSPMFFKLYNTAELAKKTSANLGSIEIQPAGVNTAQSPALLAGTLPPGERVRGHLYFNIPSGEQTYMLGFDPQAAPGKTPVAWYDLGQPAAAAPGDANALSKLVGSETPLNAFEVNSGIGLRINSVSTTKQVENTKAPDGTTLLVLDVTVENENRPNIPYNPEYFKVKDTQGYEYPPVVVPLESLLQAGSLKERAAATGRVIFQIPENTKRLVVQYQPVVIGETYEEFRLFVDVP